MKANNLQLALFKTYNNGEYAGIQRGEDLRTALSGDTLFRFLFNELDDDCLAEAASTESIPGDVGRARLLRAISEISEVAASL